MNYRYVAFDQAGRRVEGWYEAPDESAAEEALWQQGLTVARLHAARRRTALHELFPTFFGVRRNDLIVFSRQLATLLSSGISILQALQLLADQSSSQALRDVLREIVGDLEQGRSFSAALGDHPHTFPDLYARTITVGERTGNLDSVLRRLATYLDRERELLRKMRDALAYPAFVLVVAIGVVILVLTVALPPMVQLFETFGGNLPWPTRALIAASRFTTSYGLYVLFAGLILASVGAWWVQTPVGKRVKDAVLLRLPVVGPLILQGQISRFARTSSTLIRAGLPLAEVIDLAVQTCGNTVVADALERARGALLGGRGLSEPLATEPIFPTLLSQMVRVGEETGTLEDNLETLADFYEEEVDRSVQLMASLVEPALTVFVGLIVAFIALSMVMPMYSVLSEIK